MYLVYMHDFCWHLFKNSNRYSAPDSKIYQEFVFFFIQNRNNKLVGYISFSILHISKLQIKSVRGKNSCKLKWKNAVPCNSKIKPQRFSKKKNLFSRSQLPLLWGHSYFVQKISKTVEACFDASTSNFFFCFVFCYFSPP